MHVRMQCFKLFSCVPIHRQCLQQLPFGNLNEPKSQRFLRFAIAMPIADPGNRQRFPRQEKAVLHCDLRVRWKVASDLRFGAAISEPKTHSFCGISSDLALSTRKSLAIAIVRFCCAKATLFWKPTCRPSNSNGVGSMAKLGGENHSN